MREDKDREERRESCVCVCVAGGSELKTGRGGCAFVCVRVGEHSYFICNDSESS